MALAIRAEKRKCNFASFLSFSSFFGLMNMKSYTSRVHLSIIVKDFLRGLPLKAIQRCDFIFMFSSRIGRVSARVCSNFSESAQLKLREMALKRLKVAKAEQPLACIHSSIVYGMAFTIC